MSVGIASGRNGQRVKAAATWYIAKGQGRQGCQGTTRPSHAPPLEDKEEKIYEWIAHTLDEE
eukprot:5746328-Ditylum_brightwellii.AAC.1